MVLRPEPLFAAIESALGAHPGLWRVLLTPQGEPLDQPMVRELCARRPGLLLVTGRYEGVDERVRSQVDQEISIGDYVLSGGEVAALAVLDACVRLIPGVMGKIESGTSESFEDGGLEYPHYTKPREWEGRAIPDVLLSGDHAKIARWRREQGERITRERRPDLAEKFAG
ncbi:MAG: tRNA (guanosine(37)-N1)-methyltransferase TrmD, partial [Pseudomonadota bacterium]|nr:tRNA (guanosine(37)-N1)-methyltransferase TrmD [Pseudomonadota bacterium]